MQEKPRVGLVLMRAEWSVCAGAEEAHETLQADTRSMVARLNRDLEVQGPWVIDSAESLQACQQALRSDTPALDMVLLAFQTWSDDTSLISLLQAIGTLPLVLWCYLPWRRMPHPASFNEVLRGSGPVGTFGALGTLRNLGVPFLFTFGAVDDPRLIEDLIVAGRAARVRQGLRRARFGVIPAVGGRMQGTFVDPFRLETDLGPVVQNISVEEYHRVSEELPAERVAAWLAAARAKFQVRGVADTALERAVRPALGLAQLAVDHHLDVVSINDLSAEMRSVFNLRPALYPTALDAQVPADVLFQPEGDLGAATANYILHCLSGSPTMMLELWSWDEALNQLFGGHGGLQNPALADPKQVWITHDYDICHPEGTGGAQFQFIAREGRVTFFQLRSTNRGWQAIAASGMCLEGSPFVEGCSHAIIRLDASVGHFLNKVAEVGATQHWILAYGSVLHELEAFCQMEKIPVEIIRY